jgi:hypothetical protein
MDINDIVIIGSLSLSASLAKLKVSAPYSYSTNTTKGVRVAR